jgi:hypothetical protein
MPDGLTSDNQEEESTMNATATVIGLDIAKMCLSRLAATNMASWS